jgi:hypothetical protein
VTTTQTTLSPGTYDDIHAQVEQLEHRSECLVNVHVNRPLTPPLRRIDRQQSVRWGNGAGRQNHSRKLAVSVAARSASHPGASHGHERIARHPR